MLTGRNQNRIINIKE
uniref:Uncharacterized protein n=1 Tax=Arundo donax TaxID=35708 RepID=A0A0A8Z8M6_ARUDO